MAIRQPRRTRREEIIDEQGTCWEAHVRYAEGVTLCEGYYRSLRDAAGAIGARRREQAEAGEASEILGFQIVECP